VDLAVIVLLTIGCIPVAAFTEGLPRMILGAVVLLIFPGYAAMAALFPAKKDIANVERAGLSLVLSIAIVSLTDLALNYSPWGIRTDSVIISTVVIVLGVSGIAFLRRGRLDKAERFAPNIHMRFPKWDTSSGVDRALGIALAVTVLASAAALTYVIARPKATQGFTDFYVLGPQGTLGDYPVQITMNDVARVTLGITNHENHRANYRVEVKVDGNLVQNVGPTALADTANLLSQITRSSEDRFPPIH
jgi:uncharacterized membrane protein